MSTDTALVIETLIHSGWLVETSDCIRWEHDRYTNLPSSITHFLSSFDTLKSEDCKEWFFSTADFLKPTTSGFSPDEFERISLDVATGDPEWEEEIVNFWNLHIPIYMNVRNQYEYIAYDLENDNYVQGSEPEFEETKIIGSTLLDVVKKITKHS